MGIYVLFYKEINGQFYKVKPFKSEKDLFNFVDCEWQEREKCSAWVVHNTNKNIFLNKYASIKQAEKAQLLLPPNKGSILFHE